jgi:hypothetical protein
VAEQNVTEGTLDSSSRESIDGECFNSQIQSRDKKRRSGAEAEES